MENKTNLKLEDFQFKIKKESQEDEVVTSAVNDSDLNASTDGKMKMKNEPLEEEASCSSIKIMNSFSVPTISDDASATSTSSMSNNLNDSSSPIALIRNGVVKTEPMFIKTESGDKGSDSSAERNKVEIKKEAGFDNISSNSNKPMIPCDDIKKENNTNVIKKENENSTIDQNNSNGFSALPQSNSVSIDLSLDPSIAIANILTSSIPSTSVNCSSTNDDQNNDVTSSNDGKPACRYGKSCYRLNSLHRMNFYHPPGSDPLKSPEKPKCKYGTRCYRKSEEHRKRFIHDRSPHNVMSNTRRRKVKNAASQTTSLQYESDSDDSYLYDDYDGTSDEFHPDSDNDTDSDETDFEPDADDSLLTSY